MHEYVRRVDDVFRRRQLAQSIDNVGGQINRARSERMLGGGEVLPAHATYRRSFCYAEVVEDLVQRSARTTGLIQQRKWLEELTSQSSCDKKGAHAQVGFAFVADK